MNDLQGDLASKAQQYVGEMATGALVGGATPLAGVRQASPEEMAQWKEEAEAREREGKASHSIAQAAYILGLFAEKELFKYGAGTDFAAAISKLAISTITENGKIFR